MSDIIGPRDTRDRLVDGITAEIHRVLKVPEPIYLIGDISDLGSHFQRFRYIEHPLPTYCVPVRADMCVFHEPDAEHARADVRIVEFARTESFFSWFGLHGICAARVYERRR